MLSGSRGTLSLAKLANTTLRDISAFKQRKVLSNSLARLREFKTAYDQPFLERKVGTEQVQNQEEEEALSFPSLTFEPDFASRSLRLCEEVVFHVSAFLKIFKQAHRMKGLLTKMHGWDEHFEEILFPNRRAELRIDFSPQEMQQRLGFGFRTLKTRNAYNKLRLFLGELMAFNKKQQEMESRFMKVRLANQLHKLDKEMVGILSTRVGSKLYREAEEIARSNEAMLQKKLRIRNKAENIAYIEENLGKMKVKEFYLKEEGSIRDIENFIINNRLKRES